MNFDLKLCIAVISGFIIIILYNLVLTDSRLMKTYSDNNRWEILEVTGEWSNDDDKSLGEYLSEKWVGEHSGSIPDKIQERCDEIVNHYIDVVSNVRKASVSKTIDTETYVIKFTSADGEVASLWLDENGEINSVSEY